MAGLIQQQMPQAQQAPQAQEPEADESNPAFVQALEFAMKALYEGGAAKQMAQGLRMQANNVPDALAHAAYEAVSIVDERTEGAVPDELLVLLASRVLEEVAEIADAAGLEVKPSDVALALKQMILRFLGEQGADTTQLQQAMDSVDPEEFNRMATEGT